MDTAQKVIVILLIVALLFSVGSIVLNLSMMNYELPRLSPRQNIIYDKTQGGPMAGGVGITVLPEKEG